MCERLFNDKRVITVLILGWSVTSALVFYLIMAFDDSPFLNFGPSERTELFGVKLDNWTVWWAVAIYTFISTCIGAYSSDSIIPWITNTIQDHKTQYIPYSKFTCLLIIQVFTFYGVTQSIIGLFVALTQVDFMLIRLLADWLVNHYTTKWFLRFKRVDSEAYYAWAERQKQGKDDEWVLPDVERELENNLFPLYTDNCDENGEERHLVNTCDSDLDCTETDQTAQDTKRPNAEGTELKTTKKNTQKHTKEIDTLLPRTAPRSDDA